MLDDTVVETGNPETFTVEAIEANEYYARVGVDPDKPTEVQEPVS